MSAPTTASPAEARALKVDGQERSGARLTDEHRAAFRAAVLARVAPGEGFTINDVRAELDAAGVPPATRGRLFALAAGEGLIEAMTFRYRGTLHPATIPSDGRSAHGKPVTVWVRLADAGGPP